MLCKNLVGEYVLWFAMGALCTFKVAVGYTYLIEFSPYRYKPRVGTVFNVLEAFTIITCTFYYQCISKDWFYYPWIGVALNTIGVIGLLTFVPESPLFLVKKGRIYEAR
mmetsp:Transcript_13090/g.9131  ORF Transcript_13090/g.9131 Transcript_13090/m.9131 type:complete len:109 (+) Transcript_13090:615-941(+)